MINRNTAQHKRKTFDQVQVWHTALRHTRIFNEMTGSDWTPRQLQQAGADYVTGETRRQWRREWNRRRMGLEP
jgi:hypothetical protein